ncbi:hypothetical protein D3C76_910210 [compost metagenome]
MNKTRNHGPRHDSTRPPGQVYHRGGGSSALATSRAERYSFPDAADEEPVNKAPSPDRKDNKTSSVPNAGKDFPSDVQSAAKGDDDLMSQEPDKP